MKTRVLIGVIVLVLSMAILITGCSQSSTPVTSAASPATNTATATTSNNQVYELTVLYGTSKGDVSAAELDGPNGWIADMEKASGGRIKISTVYYTGQLMADPEAYDGIINGAADIAINGTNWTPARFPLANGLFINDISSHTAKPSTVAQEVYVKYPFLKTEFKETQLLGIFARTNSKYGSELCTTKKAVRTLADIRGLKVAAPGGFMGDSLTALGASPMMVPPFDQFQAMQKGIVDGAAMDLAFYREYSLAEIVKYQTDINFDNSIPWYITMNKNSWNKLPADLQEILTKTAQTFGDKADTAGNVIVGAIVDQAVKDFGIEIIEISPEEMNKCTALQQKVIDEYLVKVDPLVKDQGVTAKEIHDYLMSLRNKYQ